MFPNTANTSNGGGSTSSGGIFGNTAAGSGTGTTPNMFGGAFSTNTGTTTGSGGTAFGSTPSSGATTGGIFGGGGTGSSTGGIFGGATSSTANNASSIPKPSIFGGGGGFGSTTTSSTPSTGTTSAFASTAPSGGLFGTPKPDQATKSTASDFFSKPPNTTTDQASNPTTSGIFGQTLNTGNASTDQSSSAAKLQTPGLFSQPSAAAGTEKPSGGLFGSAPKAAEASASTSAPSTAPFGNLFGNKTSATPAASGSAPAAPPPISTFSLGGNKDATTSKDGAAPAASSVPDFFGMKGKAAEEKKDAATVPSTFNLFGATKPSTKDAPAAAPSAFSLGGTSKDGEKSAAPAASRLSTTPATSSVTVAVPAPSTLKGKSIEEIVNRWSTDLEKHVKEFNQFASEVAVWDRALIENGNNLAALYNAVLAAEREQSDIDQSLDHIEQQQKELSSALEAYEKVTEDILGGQGGSLRALDTGPADTERDKNYMLATELHGHLDDLSASLVQMIDSVNTLSTPNAPQGGSGEDPMGQIAQILSSHLESLQWIDGAVREVDGKVVDVERRVRGASEGVSSPTGGFKSRGFGLGR